MNILDRIKRWYVIRTQFKNRINDIANNIIGYNMSEKEIADHIKNNDILSYCPGHPEFEKISRELTKALLGEGVTAKEKNNE